MSAPAQRRLDRNPPRPVVQISRPVPLARANTAPEPEVKEVTVRMPELRIKFDRQLKLKMLFLVGLMLVFFITCVMFDKASFATKDIANLSRVQYSVEKLYSPAFILFIFLFSLCLALAIYFGAYQHPLLALLVLPATIIPALILAVFMPKGLLPFVAFSLTLTAAASIASIYKKMSFSRIWSTSNKAVMILALLAFVIVYGKVAADKDAHIDLFLNGVAGAVPGGQDLSAVVQALPIDGNTVKKTVETDTIQQIMSKDDFREVLQSYPGYAALPASEKQSLVDSTYDAAVAKIKSGVDSKSGAIASTLKTKLAEQLASSSGGQQQLTAGMLKQQLSTVPAFVQFYNNFALFSGFLAFGIVMVIGFFIQLITTGTGLLLSKIEL